MAAGERRTVCWREVDSNFQYAEAVKLGCRRFFLRRTQDGATDKRAIISSSTVLSMTGPQLRKASIETEGAPFLYRAEQRVIKRSNGLASARSEVRQRSGARTSPS